MSHCCHECGVTLLSDSQRIYEAAYLVSAMRRHNGRLLISQQGTRICGAQYGALQDQLRDYSGSVPGELFFVVDDKDGFDGAAAPVDRERKGYQFLSREDAKRLLSRSEATLLPGGLEGVTWIHFAAFKKGDLVTGKLVEAT